jgi:hypothetical protein
VKAPIFVLLLAFAAVCEAQGSCVQNNIASAADKANASQSELRKLARSERTADWSVPAGADAHMRDLKDALTHTADAALACAATDADPASLQDALARALHANPPQPKPDESIQENDPRYSEALGSYGHNLLVHVSRPANVTGLLAVQFSINIECGDDNMLLVYALHNGLWRRQLRWQANKFGDVSDAFGDFFLAAFLPGEQGAWRVVVAHGYPWCTSRLSAFDIDLLAPGADADAPPVLWHTKRFYSRGNFEPTLKATGNIFELRVNADETLFDMENSFERRVIYRYQVTENGVKRTGPVANHARGFVEEWISAPWEESRNLTATDAVSDLMRVYEELNFDRNSNNKQYLSYSAGPVRACAAPGVFQVEMNSSREITVPGKPEGESKLLPDHYFHVREGKNGYTMLSAPTTPDPACTGADLMRSEGN